MATETKIPRAPKGLGGGGRKIWAEAQKEFQFDVWELGVLVEVCRLQDRLDSIAAELDLNGLTVVDRFGSVQMSPLVTEARLSAAAMARLMASLRLPTGDEETSDQKRHGVRGNYGAGQ